MAECVWTSASIVSVCTSPKVTSECMRLNNSCTWCNPLISLLKIQCDVLIMINWQRQSLCVYLRRWASLFYRGSTAISLRGHRADKPNSSYRQLFHFLESMHEMTGDRLVADLNLTTLLANICWTLKRVQTNHWLEYIKIKTCFYISK